MSKWAFIATLAILMLTAVPHADATEQVVSDYMLNCQGCHLDDGRGFPLRGVPKLTNYLGNFLKVPGGREFLIQVPGSAQSSLSNERLASLLNWMLKTFSPNQLPENFGDYSATEVAHLRISPLVEVAAKRANLVQQIEKLTQKSN